MYRWSWLRFLLLVEETRTAGEESKFGERVGAGGRESGGEGEFGAGWAGRCGGKIVQLAWKS